MFDSVDALSAASSTDPESSPAATSGTIQVQVEVPIRMSESASSEPLLRGESSARGERELSRVAVDLARAISKDGDESEGVTSTEYLSMESLGSPDRPRGGFTRDVIDPRRSMSPGFSFSNDAVDMTQSDISDDHQASPRTSGLIDENPVDPNRLSVSRKRPTRLGKGTPIKQASQEGKNVDGPETSGRKRSQVEIEIDKYDKDDPEFGESFNQMVRLQQQRKTLSAGKRGRAMSRRRSSRSSRASARSTASSRSELPSEGVAER